MILCRDKREKGAASGRGNAIAERKRKMRVYISGAISGTDDYMERFQRAEDKLNAEGIKTINPAKVNENLPFTYEEYMKIDLLMIDMCDGIYMMHGWQKSPGANRELGYALAKEKTLLFEENGE